MVEPSDAVTTNPPIERRIRQQQVIHLEGGEFGDRAAGDPWRLIGRDARAGKCHHALGRSVPPGPESQLEERAGDPIKHAPRKACGEQTERVIVEEPQQVFDRNPGKRLCRRIGQPQPRIAVDDSGLFRHRTYRREGNLDIITSGGSGSKEFRTARRMSRCKAGTGGRRNLNIPKAEWSPENTAQMSRGTGEHEGVGRGSPDELASSAGDFAGAAHNGLSGARF